MRLKIYSAIWNNDPLHNDWWNSVYVRDSIKEVTLSCLHGSQNPFESLVNKVEESSAKGFGIESIIDEVKRHLTKKSNNFSEIYGISQNPDTNYYILYGRYKRDSNKEIVLKCLHNSQNPVESIINEVKNHLKKQPPHNFFEIYGISQNPDTNDYTLVQNYFTWTSGNEEIDDFIQEIELKTNNPDIVFEWIPYNQFDEIKETGKNGYTTVYSAIWKDGPLHYHYGRYKRDPNKEIILKCLHSNSQNPVESIINEVEKHLIINSHHEFFEIYGISQNPIEFLISEIIKYSIWKNGPLHYQHGRYKRDSEIILKCFHNLQNPVESIINEVKRHLNQVESLLNEVKRHLTKKSSHNFFEIYGISQKPDTNDYILVQNDFIWTSENDKIDDFIQKMQLETNNLDIVFEWIPYSQFNEINETGKNGLMTVYSAIWKNGPLHYQHGRYKRDLEVILKYLHNSSQNPVESILNEVKRHLTKKSPHNFFEIYGISQKPDTNDYILVQNDVIWTSENEKIDDFIQKMQLETNNLDIVFEWIPYSQFNEINETGKNGLMTVYSAIWKNGPLYYQHGRYKRDLEVILKYLHNSQNPVESIINEVKRHLTIKSSHNFFEIYGISQKPDTNDYILVQNDVSWTNQVESLLNEVKKHLATKHEILIIYGISQNPNTNDYILVQNNIIDWISSNEMIDEFIQELQLKPKILI
ncbi:kinase-like domain-containing protein [Rhizophagus irregularis DAOM 181602=DAOM 197198]|nr:kinase-like domain-containing protein [Rhizophagus irregularis DAOM 181602=DAOM 197198]